MRRVAIGLGSLMQVLAPRQLADIPRGRLADGERAEGRAHDRIVLDTVELLPLRVRLSLVQTGLGRQRRQRRIEGSQ